MVRRIKDAIRVLMGRPTTEEQVIKSELRLMTVRLEIADELFTQLEKELEWSGKMLDKTRLNFKGTIATTRAELADRRAKSP